MKSVVLMCTLALLAACTWVKPTPKSHAVVVMGKDDVLNCVKKGVTSSKTLSKFLFIPRSKEKIYNELVILAKNEAVIMEGDSLVPKGEIVGGALDFSVYRCR